ADLDELSLGEVYRSGQFILPIQEIERLPQESHWDRALVQGLKAIDETAGPLLKRSIKSLLKPAPENP
ncbi:MAG: hypothetical protein ACOCVP_02505, partial [Wenzhouxiangella sp.]